ncbi:MAG: M1 family metallopeptidase [Acidobacteriaceae bacterium]|nr:M1 family metallopeptidase [Acidobacteriaceae bacterium]
MNLLQRLSSAALAAACLSATAQTALAPGNYKPLETFAPLAFPQSVNDFRSASGSPGAHYWQNRASYEIHASLDPAAKTITATETITYTNHSPDTLDVLWLNLEQNTYRMGSRSSAFANGGHRMRTEATSTDGYILSTVELLPAGKAAKPVTAKYVVSDTRMRVELPTSLQPGASTRLRISYHYTVPGEWGGRTSWGKSAQGEIFDIAQWFPRLCVYDDLRGWNTEPYLANEFFLDYGDYSYFVTVPSNFLVSGSGDLVNPDAVLTTVERTRLAAARHSDKTVILRTPEEAAAASAFKPTTTRTWHFVMHNTRDVAFTASPVFVWDAARINLPGGKTALAQSVYPAEAAGQDAWSRSTEYIKDAVERFSNRWYPYPYPNAINVAGPTEGMEYPGIVFDGPAERKDVLFYIGAHEIGHTWFPMIVGSNERTHGWMDEGFNTFIDVYESNDFNHGEYGPKRDGEYAPAKDGGTPADQIVKILADPNAPSLMMRSDLVGDKYRHPVTYFKAAFGLTLLREQILGPERFDRAFRRYINDWAYKHPSPSDFFRTMESEGGEDLTYFWRGWYFENWQRDVAITAATYTDPQQPARSVKITVENRDKLVLPCTLRVELEGGQHIDIDVPAETWMRSTTHTFTIPTPAKATRALLDPDHRVPDSDRSNDAMDVR